MKTELVGKWRTVYTSDDGRRTATVEPCRVFDPDTAYCVETYDVGKFSPPRFFNLKDSRPETELGAHVIAQAWVNERSAS